MYKKFRESLAFPFVIFFSPFPAMESQEIRKRKVKDYYRNVNFILQIIVCTLSSSSYLLHLRLVWLINWLSDCLIDWLFDDLLLQLWMLPNNHFRSLISPASFSFSILLFLVPASNRLRGYYEDIFRSSFSSIFFFIFSFISLKFYLTLRLSMPWVLRKKEVKLSKYSLSISYLKVSYLTMSYLTAAHSLCHSLGTTQLMEEIANLSRQLLQDGWVVQQSSTLLPSFRPFFLPSSLPVSLCCSFFFFFSQILTSRSPILFQPIKYMISY